MALNGFQDTADEDPPIARRTKHIEPRAKELRKAVPKNRPAKYGLALPIGYETRHITDGLRTGDY